MRRIVPFALLVSAGLVGSEAFARQTTRESINAKGAQARDASFFPSLSDDGSLIAFESRAGNLVPHDTNTAMDVFVRNRVTGIVTRVSVDTNGNQANRECYIGGFSKDGSAVVFASEANNLVAGDANNQEDIFVHDLVTAATTRVSVDSSGAEANFGSYDPAISGDGRFVVFASDATNLVPNDTNSRTDIFLFDRTTAVTTRVSVDASGNQGNGTSDRPAISADGSVVVFYSSSSNLVPNDTNGSTDIFAYEMNSGAIERVSVDSSGSQANSYSYDPAVSGDGSRVAFQSWATNLVANDTNAGEDVFVRDRSSGTTSRASVDSSGNEGDAPSVTCSISSDGRCVAFLSYATNLVAGDTNGKTDVFRHKLATGETIRESVDSAGVQSNDDIFDNAMNSDGHLVAFSSNASNLVSGDTNATSDVFVREECVDASWSNYGAGWAGTLGAPTLVASANPVLGTSVTLTISNSLGVDTPALLIVGLSEANVPTSKDGTFLVAPLLWIPLLVPIAGEPLTGALPNDGTLCGMEIDLQAIEIDSGASKGLSFTPGLQLILGA